MRRRTTLVLFLTAAGLTGAALWLRHGGAAARSTVPPGPKDVPPGPIAVTTPAPRLEPLVCPGGATTGAPSRGNPEARRAAQRGLAYLAASSQQWTAAHKCFGCHVQAVTLEALAVGKHHQYQVEKQDLQAMVDALLLGVTAGGRTTGAAFEGQAWARYDQYVDPQHQNELLRYARELVGLQHQDGSIPDDDARLPVTGGTMHTTYQAMQTWRQAYARTADDKWLAPMRRAERYLSDRTASWKQADAVYLQDLNLALLGLVAAGVGPSEASSLRVQRLLVARQNQDGGWGLGGAASDALATGQTLYALKLAGHSDGESAIERGTAWLVSHQASDGAWRTVRSGQGGAEKGEGMWAVLGLVAMDVMSLDVKGIVDGQHVIETMSLEASARDNTADGVSKVELYVDDLRVAGQCGVRVNHEWRTGALTEGRHFVDVVATNRKGKESRRRFEVYAGNVYMTEVGTRFDEGRQATDISVRNIAPTVESAGKIELDVFEVKGDKNEPGKKVWSGEQAGTPGAMTFSWNGVDSAGKAQPRGRYVAELVMRDAKGKVVQRQSALFFQDGEVAQRAQYGEVEGKLGLRGAGSADVAAHSVVELLNEKNEVVQRTTSNDDGNFRFKNVTGGKYRVRAQKQGWESQASTPVTAAPAAEPAKANLTF